ncbi:MAG: UDP-N-acetylglucosamine 2-epimerase (non-hydrolyzing) [Rhodospirillaceae bacterium]|nr:UDP-N-acetylglucosamine 2-epimerase (non-hydrolyzing) [Rhodospirillaceae bacterium]|tara:strand:- start:87773 stop:88882 length:1110 start_codon:yes stop_codon:yes gene_type:complete
MTEEFFTHVVGARPQFIKLSPVVQAMSKQGLQSRIVHTGQHYDHAMSRSFFDDLGIPLPDENFEVGSGNHGEQTAKMLVALEQEFLVHSPRMIIIYGDTNSTLAAAIAGAKLNVPIAHVEAGIRANDIRMPEEINRIVADRLSSLLFAPSQKASEQMLGENIPAQNIAVVGDVMYDVAIRFGETARENSQILEKEGLQKKNYVLATIHRAENTDDKERLKALVDALSVVAKSVRVVLPVHPRTRAALKKFDMEALAEKSLKLIEPVGYLDMVQLTANARIVASDSGGVPKEAYFHNVRSVILREDALWDELIELDWAALAPPTSSNSVSDVIKYNLDAAPGQESYPYGKGDAAPKIAEALANWQLERKS